MAITIRLDKIAQPIFRKMAKDAGIGVHDLAEIACYNLIALWARENGPEVAPGIHSAITDPASESPPPIK